MSTFDIQSLKAYSLEDTTLRDYQQDNKQKIYDAWGRTNSVMLQMPTGTGKTRLFVSIIKDIFHYSRDTKVAFKVLILVHRTELIDQIDEELGFKYNLAHGFIQSGEKERKIYPIQLASVQTLSRRLDNWTDKEFDFIIVDEAHHIKADSYQKIIKAFPHAKLLGVTATPVRLNGHGFTDTFEELIVSPSVKQFIEDGYLSQYEYYSVARSSFIQKEIDGIKKFSQGDYAESELERVCDNDRIRAQVVKTYLDFAKEKKGIVYTINKEHNKNLCKEYNGNGILAVAIDSDTPKELREKYIQQFRRGDFKIICNVNLFTEGFDCPDIEFIQLARPTKSLALYLQQVGRGLRISENKEKTLFLDNVGLYNRFGFPSSKRMWKHHFEGKYDGNKTEEEVEVKKEVNLDNTIKRERHQNLEEGHETVHLIQTTDEKEYFEKRKEQFLSWVLEYALDYINSINDAFNRIKYDGMEICVNSSQKTRADVIQMYGIRISKITPSIEHDYQTSEFYFYEIKDGKITNEESRQCHSYQEYEEKYTSRLHNLRRDINKSKFKELTENYKALHFSYTELADIVTELIDNKERIPFTPNGVEEKSMNIGIIILNIWFDSLMYGIKKYKVYQDLLDIIIEYMKTRNSINKDIDK